MSVVHRPAYGATAVQLLLLVLWWLMVPTSAKITCRIGIQGHPKGNAVLSASLRCSGGTISADVDEDWLGAFKHAFQGVQLDPQCHIPGCLMTICGTTQAVLDNISIRGVVSRHEPLRLLCISNSSKVEVQGGRVVGNVAKWLTVWNNADVIISGSYIANNTSAFYSGVGVGAGGNASVTITGNSSIEGNHAVNGSGGGLSVSDDASVTITGSSRIKGNQAAAGGGLAVSKNAGVAITGCSSIAGNVAVNSSGGGLAVSDNASVTITGSSSIKGNTAVNASGGGLAVLSNAGVAITGSSSIKGNTAINASGGGLAVGDDATVTITGNSSIRGNRAITKSGGGLFIAENASVTITGNSSIEGNGAVNASGGGLAAVDNAYVTITGNNSIKGNYAVNKSGGGLAVGGNASVTITGNSSIKGNSIASNRILAPGQQVAAGGGLMVYGSASVTIMGDSRITDNVARNGPGGAIAVDSNASLTLAEHAMVKNNTCTNTLGGGLYASGRTQVLIGAGVIFANNSAFSGAVWQWQASDVVTKQTARLTLAPGGSLTRCNSSVYLQADMCERGEVRQNGVCRCCSVHTYALRGGDDASCEPCPAHAACPGGAEIQPMRGYWHSSVLSPQIHKCPFFTEACGERGVCEASYTGPLCGACLPGYGSTAPLRCGKCMAPQKQLGIYALICCLTVLLITFTVHFTWKDNLEGSRDLRITDLIKLLVQFLQFLVILGSMSAPWPPFLRSMFRASSVVFGSVSGEAVSLACGLSHYPLSRSLSLSLQGQLVYFIAPLAVFVVVLVTTVLWWSVTRVWQLLWLWYCRRRPLRGRAARDLQALQLVRKLPVMVLVVAYFAYPSLVKASLAFFACLNIDDASKGPFPEYAPLNATAGYWVFGIEQACFSSWHRAWALGLGLVAVVVSCVGVPVAIFWGMAANQSRCDEAGFRQHFGFLYRNFRTSRVWWEAVWALQVVALTAVSVFHFSLEAHYSLLLLLLAFVASAYLQAMLKPYTRRRLHRLHLLSFACLFLTSWGALALFTVDKELSQTTRSRLHLAIGVLVLAMDAGFVLWCLLTITASTDWGAKVAGKLQVAFGGFKLPPWRQAVEHNL